MAAEFEKDAIDAEEARSLLRASGYYDACPACHSWEWIVDATKQHIDLEKVPVIKLSDRRNSAPEEDSNVPVVVVLCAVCGFIRIHERGFFDSFLDDLRKLRAFREKRGR
jgi:hypothetical protein